jgi:hypothetical protein
MKLIGYWIRSLADDEFLPPQELVTEYAPATRDLIADYLDAGATFAVYRGFSWCRFFCDHQMGNCELTDGEWVWPQDLSHYVRDHDVRLPDEFVECALGQSTPAGAPSEVWATITPDERFWISWCTKHRSNSLVLQIQSARQMADLEAQRMRVDAILERERAEGVSDTVCQRAGCNNHALVSRVLCASCILKPESSWRLSGPYMNLRPVLE